MTDTAWEALGPAPADVLEARLVLHQAVQLVAAVGQSLSPAALDDSQQSLELSPDLRTWRGKLKAGLEPRGLVLLLWEKQFPLAGRTLAEGLAFLQSELSRPLALPKHPADFPRHPLADGARSRGRRSFASFSCAALRQYPARARNPAAQRRMSEPAFRLTRASKRYAGSEGVGPIDLEIAEGSTTVLLGTSGAG